MRRKLIYTTACLAIGVALVTTGALLVLPSSSYRIPDLALNEIHQPLIEVFAATPAQPILVLANFKNDDDYTLTFLALGLDEYLTGKASPVPAKPVEFWVQLKPYTDHVSWHDLTNLREITIDDPQGPSPTSHDTGATSGSSAWAGFTGTLDTGHPYAALHFTSPTSSYVTEGPYLRVSLPTIDTETSDANLLDPSKVNLRDLATSKLDGRYLYPPDLGVSVTTSPFEELNSNLVAQRVYPQPDDTAPLTWHVKGRFFPDLLYRDTEWDRRAANKIFIGGVAVGLGTGALLLPVSLIQPAGTSPPDTARRDTSPSTRKRRRRKNK